MPYLHVKDFKQGIDRRREKAIGVPGALWDAKNCHITRGGDIEGCKKFVPVFSVPGTYGMAVVGGQIYVFGSAASVSVPAGVQYQRLQAGSANMVRVLSAKPYSGKLYVIAQFDDGTIYAFYNGVRITDWDAKADANASFSVLADYLADLINNETNVEANANGSTIVLTSRVAGTPFTVSTSTVNGGGVNDQSAVVSEVQPNVIGTAEVRASVSMTITGGSEGAFNLISSILINAVEVLGDNVLWQTSNNATAASIAAQITLGEGTHGYSAISSGATVTISAPVGLGTTANGYAVTIANSGDLTLTAGVALSGGADPLTATAQVSIISFGGTFEAADKFTVTVNGTDYYATPRGAASGTSAHVRDKRVFSTAGAVIVYSKLTDPTNLTDTNVNSGAGVIAVSTDSEGYERIVGTANYNTQTAFFSRQSISLYNLGTDAELFGLDRVIENAGTRAARAILPFGNNEVLYLDDSGVRSLRARSGTDTPYVSDVGSAIDTFLQEYVKTLPIDTVARAVSVIEPVDGRPWVAIGSRIFVLSYFPANKIQSWSYYEPGFEIQDFARTKSRVYARSADTIYLYGGVSGDEYPGDGEMETVVTTPYLSGETPGTIKEIVGADFVLTNAWEVKLFPDPNRPEAYDSIGTVSKITGGQPHIPAVGREPTWATEFSCDRAGRRSLSSFMIHYTLEEAL